MLHWKRNSLMLLHVPLLCKSIATFANVLFFERCPFLPLITVKKTWQWIERLKSLLNKAAAFCLCNRLCTVLDVLPGLRCIYSAISQKKRKNCELTEAPRLVHYKKK